MLQTETSFRSNSPLNPSPTSGISSNEVPDVVIDTLRVHGQKIQVARDDLLPGGTKQRACIPLLKSPLLQEYNEFIYASPFCGFAQIALAQACFELNLKCQIFCETAPGLPFTARHEFTRIAESFGAKVVIVPTLEAAEEAAQFLSHTTPNALQISLGLNNWATLRRDCGFQSVAVLWPMYFLESSTPQPK